MGSSTDSGSYSTIKALAGAAATGMSVAAWDLGLAFLYRPAAYAGVWPATAPLAAMTAAAMLLHAGVWFVLLVHVLRGIGADLRAGLCGWSAAILTFFLLWGIDGRLVGMPLLFPFFTAGALIAGAVVYRIARRVLGGDGARGRISSLALMLPLWMIPIAAAIGAARLAYVDPAGSWVVVGLAGLAALLASAAAMARPRAVEGLLLGGMALLFATGFAAYRLRAIPEPLPPARTDTPHAVKRVFLIVVDTLRADAVSYANPLAGPTPNIDRIARDGIVFTGAMTPSPWTLPSMATLMTGLAPKAHLTLEGTAALPAVFTTLAEYLQSAGYTTAGMGTNLFLAPEHGLNQGFDHYDFHPKPHLSNAWGERLLRRYFPQGIISDAYAGELTDLAIEWVEQNRDRDFLLWTHYFDPHMPYDPPKDFLPAEGYVPSIGPRFDRLEEVRDGRLDPSPDERRWIHRLYEAEVRFVDSQLGRFLEKLDELGIYEDSLIILTADHGEEFWDHNNLEHGHTLYQELLNVPLIIKLPGAAKPKRIEQFVPNEDVLPTVLELCGVAYDPASITGRSLRPLFEPGLPPYQPRPIVSHCRVWNERRDSVLIGWKKYIRSPMFHREEVFDLKNDPREQRPNARDEERAMEASRAALLDLDARVTMLHEFYGRKKAQEVELDEESVKHLRGLGYLK